MESQFIQGCQRPRPAGAGLSPDQARQLWEQVAAFSGYGFNKGHATAYADVSYRMAYLKAHWPAALLCARLATWGGFHHPAMYMAEAIRLGIDIRPPHVNYSHKHFSLTWQGLGEDERAVLWMGLGQVRDLRRSVVRAIVNEQQAQPFADLRDLLQRVALQSKEITHLIQCGALDGLGESRPALLTEAQEIERAGSVMQMSLFEVGDLGQPRIEVETLKQRMVWERHLLGYPVSGLRQPLGLVRSPLPEHVPLRRLPEGDGRPVTVVGVRLPGWTGGEGFHLWDGEAWIVAQSSDSKISRPSSWEPIILRGRWVSDEWGSSWLEIDEMRYL
jgi:DNA polymerase III alpha subunit